MKLKKYNATAIYDNAIAYVQKVVCAFEKQTDFDASQYVVAIVFEDDFDFSKKAQNLDQFTVDMMNFQIPRVIQALEPRIADVGVCLNVVTKVYPEIVNWLQLHEEFKAAKLIMYDITPNKTLKATVFNSNKFDFVDILDYDVDFKSICENSIIESYSRKYPNLYESYKKKMRFGLSCNDSRECWRATITLVLMIVI